MINNKFKIIVPVYNADKYIKKCIDSILCQSYKNFDIIIMDDASTDNTSKIIDVIKNNTNDNRITIYHNKTNIKPLENTINGINLISNDKEDVIIIVDGDDYLKDEFVFDKLNTAYDEGCLLTHGSYEQLSNGIKRINKFDMPFDRKNKTHAVYHLRTFKKFLFDNIDKKDLLDEDGKYFKITGDQALLFPLIEMIPQDKVKFFEEILYVYNEINPINDFKLDLYNQERVENIIRNKEPYTKLEVRC